jgi:hypothetical protein
MQKGGIGTPRSSLVADMEISAMIFLLWTGIGLQFFQRRRQFQIQHEDKTFDETEWRLRRTGLGIESNTGSAPSFWLLLKRASPSFVFIAIITFRFPGLRTPLMLSLNVGIPLLVVFLSWLGLRRGFLQKITRKREPRVAVLAGFSIALTFLAIYLFPPARAWNRSVSIREIVLLSAGVISAYALATGIFLWKGRSIPRCD